MCFDDARRWAGSLLICIATLSCAAPSAPRPQGSVEIPLTGTDASGTPHRLHGELTFTGIDSGVVRSASISAASEVLKVELPAGRYTLTLNPEFVVGGGEGCSTAGTRARLGWLDPVQPPLVRVTSGRATGVRFDLVATDAPRPNATTRSESAPEHESPRGSPRCVS